MNQSDKTREYFEQNQPLPYRVHFGEGEVVVESAERQLTQLKYQEIEGGVSLECEYLPNDALFFNSLFQFIFSKSENASYVQIKMEGRSRWPEYLNEFLEDEEDSLVLTRKQYFQLPNFWLRSPAVENRTETWTQTGEQSHPERYSFGDGCLYKRRMSSIHKTISFRTIDIDRDLDIFHHWHNKERVFDLWELNFSKEQLKEYLEKAQKDPHQTPLILEIDGERAGYFEIYWAKEDRISPYYDNPEAYDRGFHFLIGEEKFLGSKNTKGVLTSITHFLFLQDCRTRRIVAEPRSDNKAVLKYVEMVPGWEFIKEFDFPHKRSALLSVRREDFFAGVHDL